MKKNKYYKIIPYILMALSVGSNIFVNFKSVIGMWGWAIASIGWVIYTYKKKEYALTIQNIVYTILNISGIIMWSK
jgi:hypothetical protein